MSTLFKNKILEKNISILQERGYGFSADFFHDSFQIPSHMILFQEDSGFTNLIVKNASGQEIPVYIAKSIVGRESNLYYSEDLEDSDIVVLIGLGLGYNCIEILRNINRKPRLVIVEPYEDIFKLALRTVDLTEIFSYERFDLFVGSAVDIDKIADSYKRLIPIGKVRVYTMPSYRLIFGKQFSDIEERLKNHIGAIRDNWHTTKQNGSQILSNTIINLPSLFSGAALNKLKGKFNAIPAICIAAGPSLDQGIESLQKLQKNALVIACDSSVNALLSAGIVPHIIITTDLFETNFRKIKIHIDQLRDSILIFGIESNPDNVRKYLGHKRVAVSSSSKILLDWLDARFGLNCSLPTLTSVSQMAIYSALVLGANPIVLVGMDLSYHKGRSHSAGSVIQEGLNINKMVKTTGVNGYQIFSSPKLVADKIFLEGVIAKSESRFINTSMDGALIQGTEIKSLNEILATDLKGGADINRRLSEIDWTSSISDTDAITELNEMLQKVIQFKDLCDCNEKLINEGLEANKNNKGTRELIENRVGDIKRDFDNFQLEYGLILGITELAIGEEIHEILKKRERIEAKEYENQNQKTRDEIDLISDHYRAFSRGADFFCNRLEKITTDLERVQTIKQAGRDDSIGDQWKWQIELGKHYAEINEIWQAEREYLNAIQIRDEDPSPWSELAQMYTNSELWRPARDNIEKAYRLFPNNAELMNLKTDVDDKIQGIMDQIKDAWVGGDKETTRRLLNGYLLLCPDDEQAILLKDVLRELDETLAVDSPVVEQQENSKLQFDELLANASQCIEQLEFEQAIGIIEGFIENFPQKSAALREKLGDIRVLQKDYLSAIWNYEQVMKSDPGETAVIAKIDKAKQQMTLHAQNYHLDQNQAQRATD